GGGRTDPRRGLRGVRPGGVAGGAGAGAGHRDRRVRRGAHRPQAAARAVEGADRRLRYAHRRDPADPGVHLDQRATNPAGHWSGRPPVTRATSRRLPRPSGRPRPPTPRCAVRPSPEPASPRRPSGTVPIGTGRGTGHHRTRPAGAASTSSTLAGSLSHCARPPAAPPPEHHAGALPPEAPGALPHGAAQELAAAASIASLASRSAWVLRVRGTHVQRTESKRRASWAARAASGRNPGCLIFHRPDICSTTSLESIRTSTWVAPSSLAAWSPAISPPYSATLFVARPIAADRSSSTSPVVADRTTTPHPAGPGLPRAPPSASTTTRWGSGGFTGPTPRSAPGSGGTRRSVRPRRAGRP